MHAFMQIKKADVDRFHSEGTSQSGTECHLSLEWASDLPQPARLRCKVELLGAKPPGDYFNIILNSAGMTSVYDLG